MTDREFAVAVWLLVLAVPCLTVIGVQAWWRSRRRALAVDLAGYRRRELERFPRSLP